MLRTVALIASLLLTLAACESSSERTRVAGASSASDAEGRLSERIGIAAGSRLVAVIEQGCRVPCSASQAVRASAQTQDAVAFQLYQGPSERIADARPLGTYRVPLAGRAPQAGDVVLTLQAESGGVFITAASQPDGAVLPVERMP